MSAAPPVVVALDQGGHATRALAYDLRGRLLAATSQPVETIHTAAGGVEHDGEALVAGARRALERLDGQLPAARWRAAGLAVQRSTVACWDGASGRLLGPVISWQDVRQAAWLASLAAAAPRVHALTGLPLSPHYGACKLRWCLDHLEAVRDARRDGRLCAGPLASLLLARLLEQRPFVSDEANASRTQLWSPRERRWSPELMALFGVPGDVLPRLLPTCDGFGHLRLGGARVPLTVCTGDQAAVPFAAGRLAGDTAYVNLGTGAFALRPVAAALDAAPLLSSVLLSDATQVRYVLEGTVNGAGSALEWLAQRERTSVSALLGMLGGEAAPAEATPLFLNGVAGLGSPFWRPGFASRFVGEATLAGRVRAVLESVAFLLCANLELMERHAGPPARIVASGGLSQSDFLVRTLATLTGVPVLRLEEEEATARGLAWLVAGQPADWEAPRLSAFLPAQDDALRARQGRWRAALDAALAA